MDKLILETEGPSLVGFRPRDVVSNSKTSTLRAGGAFDAQKDSVGVGGSGHGAAGEKNGGEVFHAAEGRRVELKRVRGDSGDL